MSHRQTNLMRQCRTDKRTLCDMTKRRNMNTKQKTNLFISMIVLLMAIILLTIFTIYDIQKNYKESLYAYTNQVIAKIVEEYPEQEEEIVQNIFLNNQEDDENIEDILSKYGFSNENIDIGNTQFQIIDKVILLFAIFFSIAILGIICIYALYIRKQNKKLKELDSYCKEILKGNYIIDLKEQDESDFSKLKNDIYDMTIMLKEKNSLLEKNNKAIEKLIADISHQLKTPLTSLNLINDILYTDLSEEKKKEFLDSSQKELEKINWLIKTVLNIAKLDSKTLILDKKNENAYHLCLEVKNNFKAMCEINHANIEIISNKEESINCDKKWTIEAMNNIVKNAIEHGAKTITIQLEENTMYTKVSIKDDGEGIDKEDLGHIFDRFYKAKNSKENSLGIGLAFCKSIIRNQDGDIRVKSSKKEKDSWTEFVIKLYK